MFFYGLLITWTSYDHPEGFHSADALRDDTRLVPSGAGHGVQRAVRRAHPRQPAGEAKWVCSVEQQLDNSGANDLFFRAQRIRDEQGRVSYEQVGPDLLQLVVLFAAFGVVNLAIAYAAASGSVLFELLLHLFASCI